MKSKRILLLFLPLSLTLLFPSLAVADTTKIMEEN